MPLRRAKCQLLACLIISSSASADVVISRQVEADSFALPARIGGGGSACPQGIARPQQGDKVRLLVAKEMARRDEAQLSFVVRLDTKAAYIFHHVSRTYSEFPFPPDPKQFETSLQVSMWGAAEELYAYNNLGAVGRSASRQDESEVVVREVSVESAMLGRKDVRLVEISGDEALRSAAHAVEAFALEVRGVGVEWLSLLGEPEGIPISLGEVLHQPDSLVSYREQFLERSLIDQDKAEFLPPTEYAKVDHDGRCF